MKKEIKNTRLKVFIENARLLSEDERAALPSEKRAAASGKAGVWIEVACPDGACSLEEGKVTLPAGGVTSKETKEKGLWLNLFCPDDQCVIEQGTGVL
jgi:hypothetical protein